MNERGRSFLRAAELRTDLAQLEAMLAAHDSLLLPTWRELTLIDASMQLTLLPNTEARSLIDLASELVFLGLLDGRACFALDLSALDDPLTHDALAGAGELVDLRAMGARLSQDDAELAAYARALLYWHKRHRHCSVCGAQTAPRRGGHVRVCGNEACKAEHFPRTDPAVIMLVHDGERCLLGRQRGWPKGLYSTLAGFVEPGETLEQAVAREVAEEAGVRVTDVRYFRSQPWPFPSSLMLGFFARALSTDIAIDRDELEDAAWFVRQDLRNFERMGMCLPPPYSLAHKLLSVFLHDEQWSRLLG